jgi:hypothetical protein
MLSIISNADRPAQTQFGFGNTTLGPFAGEDPTMVGFLLGGVKKAARGYYGDSAMC